MKEFKLVRRFETDSSSSSSSSKNQPDSMSSFDEGYSDRFHSLPLTDDAQGREHAAPPMPETRRPVPDSSDMANAAASDRLSSPSPSQRRPDRRAGDARVPAVRRGSNGSAISIDSLSRGSVRSRSTLASTYASTRKRVSSVARRAAGGTDIARKADGTIRIDRRESHTFNLDALEKFVCKMIWYERDGADGPFRADFWRYIRSVLEKHGMPAGFGPEEDSSAIVPKGPLDAAKFITKKIGLSSISPINPKLVAAESGIPLQDVLNELLYSTKVGLTSMRFVPQCLRCGGAVCDELRLGLISGKINCRGCFLENEIHSLDEIATVFFLHPEVLYVLEYGFGCIVPKARMAVTEVMVPIPCTTSGSGFRYSVACGAQPLRGDPLSKGMYRVNCLISSMDAFLEVLGDAPPMKTGDEKSLSMEQGTSFDPKTDSEDSDNVSSNGEIPAEIVVPFKVSDFRITDPSQERKVIKVPHGRIHFDVSPDTGSFVGLCILNDTSDEITYSVPNEERSPFTSASEIIHHPGFNRLYGLDESAILRVSSSLEISNVILVFTDVVGSTNMYASLGDFAALRCVEAHYEVLFAAFSRWGRVVKTAGDAVMASFANGRGAIEAVAAAIAEVGDACLRPDSKPFEIRVGIHSGPAIVTPLNGINDYFGQTVNVAARVEAKAEAGSCLITDAVLADPDAMAAYLELLEEGVEFAEIEKKEFKLKGVAEPVVARGFALRNELKLSRGESTGEDFNYNEMLSIDKGIR